MKNYMNKKFNQHSSLTLIFSMISIIVAVIAVIALTPLPAQADCLQDGWKKTNHRELYSKHLIQLHDALKLSENQEGAWKVFIEETKPKQPPPKFDKLAVSNLTTPERLDRMLSLMKERETLMEAHVESVKRFYSILTTEQQNIFDASFHSSSVSMENADHSTITVVG